MGLDPRENRLRREAAAEEEKPPMPPLEPDFPWRALPWDAQAFLLPVDTSDAAEPS